MGHQMDRIDVQVGQLKAKFSSDDQVALPWNDPSGININRQAFF